MKLSFVLLCLAVFVAAVYADCDPDGNNKPTCTGTSATKIRNFWDPTHYWVCSGTTATSVICDSGGFDPVSSDCVPWSEWKWVTPCPSSK